MVSDCLIFLLFRALITNGLLACEITAKRRLGAHSTRRTLAFESLVARQTFHMRSASTETPNKAMQRTASKAAIDVWRVCRPRFGCLARCSGRTVADLMFR